MYEIFKQDQYQPLSAAKQVLIYFTLVNGLMDNVPVDRTREFESALYKYADLNDEVLKLIAVKKEIDEEIDQKLRKLVNDFKETIDYLIK